MRRRAPRHLRATACAPERPAYGRWWTLFVFNCLLGHKNILILVFILMLTLILILILIHCHCTGKQAVLDVIRRA